MLLFGNRNPIALDSGMQNIWEPVHSLCGRRDPRELVTCIQINLIDGFQNLFETAAQNISTPTQRVSSSGILPESSTVWRPASKYHFIDENLPYKTINTLTTTQYGRFIRITVLIINNYSFITSTSTMKICCRAYKTRKYNILHAKMEQNTKWIVTSVLRLRKYFLSPFHVLFPSPSYISKRWTTKVIWEMHFKNIAKNNPTTLPQQSFGSMSWSNQQTSSTSHISWTQIKLK